MLSVNEIAEIQSKGKSYKIGNTTIIRIPTKAYTSNCLSSRGLYKTLEDIAPNAILHHNINPTTMIIASRYASKYQIPILCDSHVDEINVSKNKLWFIAYYKVLVRLATLFCRNNITKFYGVTPSRCDFIEKYYKVPKDKIALLPIGADTESSNKIEIKERLRAKYAYNISDFIIISGGKMGQYKGTNNLIEAVDSIRKKYETLNVKLILFGSFEDNFTKEIAEGKDFIDIYGWCDRKKSLELLKLSDIACWPIHHTTLIEDAISVNTPIVTRKTRTTCHLIDGNGFWLNNGDTYEIELSLEKLLSKTSSQMKELKEACDKKKEVISYLTIAKTIINDINSTTKKW